MGNPKKTLCISLFMQQTCCITQEKSTTPDTLYPFQKTDDVTFHDTVYIQQKINPHPLLSPWHTRKLSLQPPSIYGRNPTPPYRKIAASLAQSYPYSLKHPNAASTHRQRCHSRHGKQWSNRGFACIPPRF